MRLQLKISFHIFLYHQVYTQPAFAIVDKWCAEKFPNSRLVSSNYNLKLPFLPVLRLNLLRICFRSMYVALTTVLAMIFPYFNQVLGVLGAINFWPLSIYFPVEMYLLQRDIAPWTKKWIALQTFSIICLLITVIAFVGSVEGLITAKFS